MSARYLGGIVSRDPLTLNPAAGNAANGVFTLEQYMQAVKNATWPGFDPYFNETVLLLHGNGTNGAQNNTFLDSSTNNFTITRNGNTTQGTFSPFSLAAGEWSNYFDGVSENLSVANNAAFQFGTGDFTVEAWVYILAYTDYGVIVKCATDNSWTAGWALTLGTVSVPEIQFFVNGNRAAQASGPSPGSWNHVAVSRSGTSLRIFINGALIQTVTNSGTLVPTTALTIGADITNTNYEFNGYISNVRVVKGTAVYTSNFTPSTTPLTAITNTSLLTCQSNRFVDNSTNAFAITASGDVRVTPFSPFAPTSAYSDSVNGGSGYFDGSDDNLIYSGSTVAASGSAYTVEFWAYQVENSNTAKSVIGSSSSTDFVIGFENTRPLLWLETTINVGTNFTNTLDGSSDSRAIKGTVAINLNTWNHYAWVFNGNNITLYVNGTQYGTASWSSSTRIARAIGSFTSSGAFARFWPGYLSSVRITASAIYTSNFTPPTGPLTAISGTNLLLNFTNAGIFDNTGKNVLETVGNAQIDTAVKKYGTGSLEFDGTGDILVARNIELLDFPSGDFTVEFWYNTNTLTPTGGASSGFGFITGKANWNGAAGAGWSVWQFNQEIRFYHPQSASLPSINTGNVITSTGTWYHIAVVRSGTATNNTKIYINGVQQAQGTPTITSSAQPLLVGGTNTTYGWDSTYWTNGYIDDLRITKGVARYTANFTPQTSQWQDQ